MNKKCLQCGSEVLQIGDETTLSKGSVLIRKGDGFRLRDTYGDLTAYHYVCTKCGLIQQYVPESLREHIDKLYK